MTDELWVGLCWNYRKGHAAFLSVTQNRQETMAAAKKQVEPHLHGIFMTSSRSSTSWPMIS
jgi:hypothetical protein